MNTKTMLSGIFLFMFVCLSISGAAYGQANSGKAVLHFGANFSKSQVDDAGSGFFGGDLFAGKMITNNICLGFFAGYDIIHNESIDMIDEITQDNVTFKERLAVIPFQVKAKYYFTLSPMLQMYGGVGGGVYRAIPSLGGNSIGTIRSACNSPGGSVSLGIDYWFLLTTGVGFEFEYHMFNVPEGDLYKYWQVRVDYSLIKF